MQINITDNIHHTLFSRNRDAQDTWRATQPEVDAQAAELHRIFNNTRVMISDIEGIAKWERALGILPDLARDTKEERRDRVLEAIRTSPPFTEPWMFNEIHKRFPNGEVVVDVRGLILKVFMSVEDVSIQERAIMRRHFRELLAWFRGWIPGNMLLIPTTTTRRPTARRNIYIAGHGFKVLTRALPRRHD